MACCCWRRPKTREGLHHGQVHRSRSLDREPAGEYLDLVLEDPKAHQGPSEKNQSACQQQPAMGNSQSTVAEDGQKDTLMKSGSTSSLKSEVSHKSSSSRRSKVTFTELTPEIHMIPPKSPPKPKRSKGSARSPVTAEEEMDLIMAMRSDDEASQAAFQFDLGKQAEVVSLEDIERNQERPYAQIHRVEEPQEKIYDQVAGREDTPEDVQQVDSCEDRVHEARTWLKRPQLDTILYRHTHLTAPISLWTPSLKGGEGFCLSKHSFGSFMKSAC